MAQIKIYGLRPHLDLLKTPLSEVICLCGQGIALCDRQAHSLIFSLDGDGFFYPYDRTDRHTNRLKVQQIMIDLPQI